MGRIVTPTNINDTEYNTYYVSYTEQGNREVVLVSEKDLVAELTADKPHPLTQMKNYELHNPMWYEDRRVVSNSMHTLKNATFGFETLLGSRVFLMPHQVDTIVRAVKEIPCRFMLADEVGLGKTIEACVIMKGLKERLGSLKTLIIAPNSLIHQWKNELFYKFWTDIPIWNEELDDFKDIIFPIEKLNSSAGKFVLNQDWDLCIVDETHRLLKMETEYEILASLSKRVNNFLLLSATPIEKRKTEYLKLLSLLIPKQYGRMDEDEFTALLDKQDKLKDKIYTLVRDIDSYIEDNMGPRYLNYLKYIADIIEDSVFNQLVSKIDLEAEDMGLENVKLALAYLGEFYQIERHIIRHRRHEIKEEIPSRKLELIKYPLAGREVDFYEYESYEKLMDYIEEHFYYHEDNKLLLEYIKMLSSAFFSSPWAIESLLKSRLYFINNDLINLGFDLSKMKSVPNMGLQKKNIY
ncbi:MAG: SNF2-related protein [Halanaerobiales bacterium]